jgi:hypothetical protein
MRRPVTAALLFTLLGGLPALASHPRSGPQPDRLATEIDRWATFLRTSQATGETWQQIKAGTEPLLARAQSALGNGRRLLALQLLLTVRADLSAAAYMQASPAAQVANEAAFETEWTRVGLVLGRGLDPPAHGALEGVRPAAVRALTEAALPQSRVFYDASLEYGRNTLPEYGLYYLGAARSAAEAVELCRSLSGPVGEKPSPFRSPRVEIEALEGELLAAYRPPLSIDRHQDFIAASSLLKEARELEAAGLFRGALLRYLQAAQRFAPLRPAPPLEAARVIAELRGLAGRLSAGHVDHSLGRLFLEHAQESLSASPPDLATAAPIAADVLPRYFAALEPEKPSPPQPEPRVTVTLVRWPYT